MFPEYTESVIFVGSVEYPIYLFTNSEDPTSTLTECKMDVSTDLISSELPIDTLVFSINLSYEDNEADDFNPEMVPSGTKVYYYYGNKPFGKFYVKRLTKTGKYAWTFECENYIGLLDSEPFYGMYFHEEDRVSFDTAVKHILLSDGIRIFRPCESVSVNNRSLGPTLVFYSNYATGAHFRYDGLSEYIKQTTSLSERLYFYGIRPASNADIGKIGTYRWIFADIERSNPSEQYNETVTLRFNFGVDDTIAYPDEGLTLIEVSPGTDINISIDPGMGIITVNGKSFAFNVVSGAAHNGTIHFAGPTTVSGNYTYADNPGVNLTWFSHTIEGKTYVPVENTAMGTIDLQEKNSDGSFGEFPNYHRRYIAPRQGVEKSQFDLITYRAKEYQDEIYPASFPDDAAVEIADTLLFEGSVKAARVVGIVPKTTKRDALHQVMFACGICMKTGSNGELSFSYLSDETVNIPDTSIFDTGDVSRDDSAKYINVSAYEVVDAEYDSGKLTTVFTNVGSSSSSTAANIESLGDTPWHIYKNNAEDPGAYFTNGLSVFYTGAVALNGLPCSVLEHQYDWEIANTYSKKTISVSGCKLIAPNNVDIVGEKLLAYYENISNVRNDIIYSGERCGDKFDFTNPFGEKTTAYLSHMSLTAYGFIRASCEFAANFTPPSNIEGYFNSIRLTGNGNYSLPGNAKFPIKIVLIGGGQGGSAGSPGDDGTTLAANGGSGEGGKGGQGGKGGNGGKVRIIMIRNGSVKSYKYHCGAGGKGGYAGTDGGLGYDGEDTTFGLYSSQNGDTLSGGYPGSGSEVYASNGEAGTSGGKGGSVERIKIMAGKYAFGYTSAEDSMNAVGGDASDELTIGNTIVSSAAEGGGAAYRSDGGNAISAVKSGSRITNASGGAGANAAAPRASITQTYGCGGNGGHGGGGGGASGTGNSSNYTFVKGKGGKGGQGSNGLDGIEGCILVFYNTKEGT